jgi:hypothetical protein
VTRRRPYYAATTATFSTSADNTFAFAAIRTIMGSARPRNRDFLPRQGID